ncbi:MAG: AAA family ATPase [Gammaproteobacteria bacterium]|nr:AAA family ATPase [Gammaproteobacteria bacterium]
MQAAQKPATQQPRSSNRNTLPRVTELPLPTVADVPPLPLRATLATGIFPDLDRDIRFLKRPLLARLFAPQEQGEQQHTLMVTSDLPEAGKSFISRNLAASFAQEKMLRVLLVDADPVRRSLSNLLGVADRPGLMELIAGDAVQLSDVTLATDVEALYFVPAGQSREDATELLASTQMAAFLTALNDPNTVVVLDSPPLLLSSEGRVLADNARQVLVVVEAGRSTAADVAQVVDILRGTSATVSIAMNKVPVAALSYRHDMYYR